jgi:hypothetical protein
METTTATWSWPIDASRYNRAHGLTAAEYRFLAVELPSRIKVGRPRKTALDVVQRLVHPLHDVFDHIEFNGPKRRSLLLHLLEEMGRRNRAFWGWTEEEWIEVVECRRYDGNRIIAAAFLLRGGFAALSTLPKGRQVYSCLVCRVFGSKAVAETERQVKAGLRDLGYRARTLRIMPLTLAQLLLIVRSPRIEDITESALLQLQEQNGTVALEQCVIAMSRLLISKGILENPVRRLGLRPVLMLEAQEVILANVQSNGRAWRGTGTIHPP